MPNSRLKNQLSGIVRPVTIALSMLGLMNAPTVAQTSTAPTTINVGATSTMTNTRRLGMNLGTLTNYDSGQLLRNIAFLNPGFEGEQWQSILHCVAVTATSCTDDSIYASWPANFLKGASAEFIVGNAVGTTATVTSSTAASSAANVGVTVNFSGASIAPSVGDFVVVRMEVPGNAQAGWWPQLSSGASLSTDTTDLSPNTPGKQALSLHVPTGEYAILASYMDDYIANKSFMQMNGVYTLTFRAKSTGGSTQMNILLQRPGVTFLDQNVTLTTSWQDYSIPMTNYDKGATGALALKFSFYGASAYMDDVALTEAPASNNPTAFRNQVVTTLQALHPGTLRYMDSGQNWGSSIENLIAVDFARERPGYSNFATESDDIPLGLHDFMVLCQAIGAEPFFTTSAGMSTQEMSNLMDYMGGSTSTAYGAKRAALGQTAPWTSVFPTIHLEFGNEVWNTANPGELIADATSYGLRAKAVFGAAKASASYDPKKFDLILSGLEVVPFWNQQVLTAASPNYDTIDAATYFFTNFNDASSTEKTFGPMFAEPEFVVDNPSGAMSQQAVVAAGAVKPANLAVYETQIAADTGKVSQTAVNNTEPSVGAGIAEADMMLLAMRDLGVNDQNLFALEGYQFGFLPSAGATGAATTTQLYGSVIDMGGLTNLQRPTFLAAELANSAILPTLLSTSQAGNNPTWNQALSTNDNVSLAGAHYIQSFAFTDGNKLNIVLLNLSRTTALPVNFAGLNTPLGAATVKTLTAPAITASNEVSDQVAITSTTQTLSAGSMVTLPPYSMTTISVAAPDIPIAINSISVSCPRSSLSPNDTMVCTENVAGQGKYNADVTWSVDNGAVSSTGTYTAPSTVPASGKATLKVTSVQDTTKSATFAIALAADVITHVNVTCGNTSLGWGATTSCSATVAGTGSFTNGYTWSVSAGAVSSLGSVTAPASGTSMTVKATSTQDATKSGSVTIALTPVLYISNPVTTATSTSITVNWTNSLLARNGVQYGSGQSTPYDSTFTTSPSFTLTGLAPGTTYSLALIAYDDTQNTGKVITVTTPSTGTPTAPTNAVTGVSISCASASILLGATENCTATVQGTGTFSKAYTWSITGGTISANGLVTAPLTGSSITVKATSTQNSAKSASYTIALTSPSTVTGVAVSCASASIKQSSTTNCTATVTGTGTFSSGTTWSVSAGSVTPAGLVTAPATGSSITVKATSTQDPTKSGSFTIALTNSPATITGVAVSCATASLVQSGSTTCSAVVSGTNAFAKTVTWSASSGSVSAAGVVTAPATGTTMTVTATSTEDPSKKGTFAITLTSKNAITGVSVWCPTTNMVQGTSTNCVANVAGIGSYSTANTWSVSAGSISTTGAFNATATGTITVKATSTQDPTKSGTFAITVVPVIAISNPKTSVTSTSITVGWTVNQAARNGVTYSTGPLSIGLNTPYNATFTTSPSFTITGLQPNTKYNLWLVSYTGTQNTSTEITVTTSASTATVSKVTVSCSAASLLQGGTTSCSAKVAGTGSYSSAVKWTASAGSVTSSGAVTAPTSGTTMTVTATSIQDPTKSGTLALTLKPAALAITNPVAAATSSSIHVSWTVNVLARNGVTWSTGTLAEGQSTPYDSNFTTSPSYTLSGLKSDTVYNLWLVSYNESGATNKMITVKTAAQ